MLAIGALALGVSGAPRFAEPLAAAPAAAPSLAGCPMLPADNVWNARVGRLPVHARSAACNRGLMLRLAGGSPSAHYRVYLAEAPDPALRPKLTVVYR